MEEKFLKSVKEMKKTDKKVNFDQTVDLIINLKDFDIRRQAFNTFIELPNKVKDKKIAGFLEKNSEKIDSIMKEEFVRYKEKKDIKKLIGKYDFFVANSKLMPSVATAFGRVLGPAGKMPSPQLGIIINEDEKTLSEIIKRINSNVRIIVKEPSIKIAIAKESLDDEKIAQNAMTVYNKLIEILPRKKDNVRNVKIKLTMGKPILVEI